MSVYLQMGIYFMLAILLAAVLAAFFLFAAVIGNRWLSEEVKIPREWKKADKELIEKIKHQWD